MEVLQHYGINDYVCLRDHFARKAEKKLYNSCLSSNREHATDSNPVYPGFI